MNYKKMLSHLYPLLMSICWMEDASREWTSVNQVAITAKYQPKLPWKTLIWIHFTPEPANPSEISRLHTFLFSGCMNVILKISTIVKMQYNSARPIMLICWPFISWGCTRTGDKESKISHNLIAFFNMSKQYYRAPMRVKMQQDSITLIYFFPRLFINLLNMHTSLSKKTFLQTNQERNYVRSSKQ